MYRIGTDNIVNDVIKRSRIIVGNINDVYVLYVYYSRIVYRTPLLNKLVKLMRKWSILSINNNGPRDKNYLRNINKL